MEGLRGHVARCMQEKGQSRRRNLDRSEDESDIEGKPKDHSSLPLPLALSFAHLATTTAICTWRDCEDMSQDGMQEKRQNRRRNLYRSAYVSDILGQSKDQVVLCLCLWHFPLHTWRQLRPYAHGGTAKTCRKTVRKKKGKIEE